MVQFCLGMVRLGVIRSCCGKVELYLMRYSDGTARLCQTVCGSGKVELGFVVALSSNT